MTFIEKALLPLSRSNPRLHEFLWFGLKQAWACIFGGLLLAGILGTKFWYLDIPLARYDFLVFYAVAIQLSLLFLKLESWREIGVILLFHIMATAMELFKTSDVIGSCSSPSSSSTPSASSKQNSACRGRKRSSLGSRSEPQKRRI